MIDSLDVSGGAERQLNVNLSLFDHERLEHRVALVKRTANSREDEVSKYAQIHHLGEESESFGRSGVVRRLRALVTELAPDLIHASLPDSALAARLAARPPRIRAVESLVNISHERVRLVDNPNVTRSKLRLHAAIDRLTMARLSGFHAVSQAVADSWVRTVGLSASRIRVIPRGVDLSGAVTGPERALARESVLEEFGLPEDAFIIVSVGRVEPQKGHRYLVEATAALIARHPNLRVLIVGRPGNASALVRSVIADHDLRDVVTLTGGRRDVARLLAAADAFVFPSLFEGNGGNAMIEAMAAGLPIVTTGEPPMTDLVPDEDVGLLVGRADSANLARAIDRLVSDDALRERLGTAARARAETLPSPASVAEALESWYWDLLDD